MKPADGPRKDYPDMNRKPCILIVDDDDDIRFTVRLALEMEGYECNTAETAEQAVEMLCERPYDILVTDLNLPEKDGLWILGEIAALKMQLTSLVLTAHGEISSAVEAIRRGAYDYLMKPVDINSLARVIKRALEHRFVMACNQQLAHKWEVTFDASPDMIGILDMDRRIIRCNFALSRCFGRGKDELIGMSLNELLPQAEDMRGFVEMASEGCEGERQSKEVHDEQMHKDFLVTTAPLRDERGRMWGMVLFIRDMTEHKMMQKQLLHSQKMESVGTLAAGVAHEINNPVGFIHSNLSSLKRYLKKMTDYMTQCNLLLDATKHLTREELEDEADRLLELRRTLKIDYALDDIGQLIEESHDGTERIRKIVTNLKGFARNDDTKMQNSNLNERLDGVLSLAWNELKYKAKIIKEYGELPRVTCYAIDLDQVFVNLLINSAQAIEDKGEIRLKTWCEGRRVHISISDNGCGIPPHVLPHIFEPFFTTKPVGKGTGLGLSISYDIVTKHGGEMKVESTPGVGTTFTVTLPIPENGEDIMRGATNPNVIPAVFVEL